jgi:hypothetical protein
MILDIIRLACICIFVFLSIIEFIYVFYGYRRYSSLPDNDQVNFKKGWDAYLYKFKSSWAFILRWSIIIASYLYTVGYFMSELYIYSLYFCIIGSVELYVTMNVPRMKLED